MPADATCFICHVGAAGDAYGKPEGLVRACACRGSMGVAHMSCLVRQAWIRSEDANDEGGSMDVWDSCMLCKHEFHGPVSLALGWACWKAFEPRSVHDEPRGRAIIKVSAALGRNSKWLEAIPVTEAGIYLYEKIHVPANHIHLGRLLTLKGNLSRSFQHTGRLDEALRVMRIVYQTQRQRCSDKYTVMYGVNLASMLMHSHHVYEAFVLQRELVSLAREICGPNAHITLQCTARGPHQLP